MKVYKPGVLKLKIREAEGLSDIDVVVENVPRGNVTEGNIEITHEYITCGGYWCPKRGRTVQQSFILSGNAYVMKKVANAVSRRIDADNDTNVAFIKEEINRLFRGGRLTTSEAREYNDEAESSEDIKKDIYGQNSCICGHPHFRDPDALPWPEITNPKYKRLCRVFDAVREAFRRYESKETKWKSLNSAC